MTTMVRVVIHVEGGMVRAVYSDGEADVEVLDLDVSSYPGEGEEDEVDMKRRQLEEIAASPEWSPVW